MDYQVRIEHRTARDTGEDRTWILEGPNASAEISPALGFNCFRWRVGEADLLYAAANFLREGRPTRGGMPILFPFPNRIRAGQFSWQGKAFQLPLNDSSGLNAIHGFVCRKPWRVVDQGADAKAAWVTGEFHGAKDAPETIALWPADYRIRLTYRLSERSLELQSCVDCPADTPLPFGLGFHPYFALAPFEGETASIEVPARKYWELVANLPTGRVLDVDRSRDLRGGRSYRELNLDDVLTDLEANAAADQKIGLGTVRGGGRTLTASGDRVFREMVVFTPPHRQAICLEPYTCPTDAVNMPHPAAAGWTEIPQGQAWTARAIFQYED